MKQIKQLWNNTPAEIQNDYGESFKDGVVKSSAGMLDVWFYS